MRQGTCLLAVVIAAALSSCGGTSGAQGDDASSASAGAGKDQVGKCHEQTASFVASLDALRGRLIEAPTYEEFTHSLTSARRAYGQLPVASLTPRCLAGMGFAEDALNQYIASANLWSGCLGDPNCNQESTRPLVERKWWAAGVAVTKVHRILPENPVYTKGLPPPLPLP
jgi:hypothetical protein